MAEEFVAALALGTSRDMDQEGDRHASTREFLERMGRAYDMKAREVKADHRGIDALNRPPYLRALVLGEH